MITFICFDYISRNLPWDNYIQKHDSISAAISKNIVHIWGEYKSEIGTAVFSPWPNNDRVETKLLSKTA